MEKCLSLFAPRSVEWESSRYQLVGVQVLRKQADLYELKIVSGLRENEYLPHNEKVVGSKKIQFETTYYHNSWVAHVILERCFLFN